MIDANPNGCGDPRGAPTSRSISPLMAISPLMHMPPPRAYQPRRRGDDARFVSRAQIGLRADRKPPAARNQLKQPK
jgi:hypothetical protein